MTRLNRALACILLSLLLLGSVGVVGATRSYPKPSGNLVNDFGEMLKEDSIIEERLLKLEKASGVQFAVVTVNTLDGETIEGYAEGLFQAWGIGKKGQDNGLLLLIAKEEREMRIEVGYGLEPSIPDAFAGNLIDSILKPRFTKGEFDLGVIECIDSVAKKLEVDLGETPAIPTEKNDEYIEVIVVLALFLLFSLLTRKNRRIVGGGPRFGPYPPFRGGSPGGGGFGGFGGGRSGGGGASGKW